MISSQLLTKYLPASNEIVSPRHIEAIFRKYNCKTSLISKESFLSFMKFFPEEVPRAELFQRDERILQDFVNSLRVRALSDTGSQCWKVIGDADGNLAKILEIADDLNLIRDPDEFVQALFNFYGEKFSHLTFHDFCILIDYFK